MIKKLTLILFLLWPLSGQAYDFSQIDFQTPSKKHLAPELNLKQLRKKYYPKIIHRKAFSPSRYTILHFWQLNCHACIKSIPSLKNFYKNTDPNQLRILTISSNKEKSLQKTILKNGIKYPVLVDRNLTATEKYEIEGFPTTYIVDKKGYLVAKKRGAIDWNDPKVVSFFEGLR